MLGIIDFKVDNSDDIILLDDIIIEDSTQKSTMHTVERRLVARNEDFILDNIAAGLDSFIFQTKTSYTKDNIMSAINNALQTNGLLSPNDYKILISETNDRHINLIIKFSNRLDGADTFKLVVDIENQRIYRG
jgi:hypothetical protein